MKIEICKLALLRPVRLYSRSEVLSTPSPVPRLSGVYGWYFRDIPGDIPTRQCARLNGLTLLYIGISPGAPPRNGKSSSKQTLFHRVRYHYQGNAEGSTLRLSIGCLLSETIGIQLRRVGSGQRLTFADGEKRLSDWMASNAFVVWSECEEPWLVEEQLISTTSLPLNLDQNERHPFFPVLSESRCVAKIKAREMSIWNERDLIS